MFGQYYNSVGHVTVKDIVDANRAISNDSGVVRPRSGSYFESGSNEGQSQITDVGINYNKWRRPMKEFGPDDGGLEQQISRHEYLRDFDVDSGDWKSSCHMINILLEDVLLKEIKAQAESYDGLGIKKFVKQGSSREGLKIRKADEFDTVLLYEIKGLDYEPVSLETQPGLGMLKIGRRHNMEELRRRYPQLVREGVFVDKGSGIYLSSRQFHEKVFESIIDSARHEVERKIIDASNRGSDVGFKINRQINPPSINLTFLMTSSDSDIDSRAYVARSALQVSGHLIQESACTYMYQIDVDIVPGLQLSLATVPNPLNPGESMQCPVYAVFKWRNESQRSARAFDDAQVIWRFCTSGYEKHIMDGAHTRRSQRYILTACRLVKAYIKNPSIKKTQFGSFMKSYYLKNIAMYCILYVVIMNGKTLSGVREALGYFLDFLGVALTEERLPHFFYGNEWIKYMFPDYEFVEGCKIDLFESARKSGTLVNARQSCWRDIKEDFRRLIQCEVFSDFKERFKEFVRAGRYCDTCP